MIIWSIFSIEFLISSSCFLNFSITFFGAFSIKLSLLSLFCIFINSECSLSFFVDNLLISDLVSIIPLRGIIIVDLDVIIFADPSLLKELSFINNLFNFNNLLISFSEFFKNEQKSLSSLFILTSILSL